MREQTPSFASIMASLLATLYEAREDRHGQPHAHQMAPPLIRRALSDALEHELDAEEAPDPKAATLEVLRLQLPAREEDGLEAWGEFRSKVQACRTTPHTRLALRDQRTTVKLTADRALELACVLEVWEDEDDDYDPDASSSGDEEEDEEPSLLSDEE